MKVRNFALALVTAIVIAIALTFSTVAAVEAAEAGAIHDGKGTVLSVDIRGRRIRMTEESSRTHVLSWNDQTKVINEAGHPIPPTALQPGDLVREECLVVGDGTFTAQQIRLLRPAWMETASPER